MENEEPGESNAPRENSLSEGPANERTPVTGTTPLYATINSVSGSGAAYNLNVTVHDASNTRAGQQWQRTSNGNNDYSTYPVATVVFNQVLPQNTTFDLYNASGNLVGNGTVTDASTDFLRLVFWNMPNGQSTINGSEVFGLALSHPTPNSFGVHVIDSTSGGLVIVANIDGEEDFYDVTGDIEADSLDEYSEPGTLGNPD